MDELDAMGLEWELRAVYEMVGFDERTKQLQAYKDEHGDFNVS